MAALSRGCKLRIVFKCFERLTFASSVKKKLIFSPFLSELRLILGYFVVLIVADKYEPNIFKRRELILGLRTYYSLG